MGPLDLTQRAPEPKDTVRKHEEGVGRGTSHRILCPAEFQAEATVGASGRARQSGRIPAAGSQEVGLIRGCDGYGFLSDFTL